MRLIQKDIRKNRQVEPYKKHILQGFTTKVPQLINMDPRYHALAQALIVGEASPNNASQRPFPPFGLVAHWWSPNHVSFNGIDQILEGGLKRPKFDWNFQGFFKFGAQGHRIFLLSSQFLTSRLVNPIKRFKINPCFWWPLHKIVSSLPGVVGPASEERLQRSPWWPAQRGPIEGTVFKSLRKSFSIELFRFCHLSCVSSHVWVIFVSLSQLYLNISQDHGPILRIDWVFSIIQGPRVNEVGEPSKELISWHPWHMTPGTEVIEHDNTMLLCFLMFPANITVIWFFSVPLVFPSHCPKSCASHLSKRLLFATPRVGYICQSSACWNLGRNPGPKEAHVMLPQNQRKQRFGPCFQWITN